MKAHAVRTIALPSGEEIPALGQGTWHIGEDARRRHEEIAALRLGLDLGMSMIDTAETVAEIGYDFSREDLVTGPAVSIHSARGFVGYKATLGTGTTFDGSAEVLTNLNKEELVTREASFGEDTRINVKAALSAKIGRNLAIQTSFEGKYDNRPAPLVFGGNVLGWTADEATSHKLLDAFVDAGYSFVDTATVTSGTFNILGILDWIQNTEGWMSNETLGKVQFGWEITTENPGQNFQVDDYSVSYS